MYYAQTESFDLLTGSAQGCAEAPAHVSALLLDRRGNWGICGLHICDHGFAAAGSIAGLSHCASSKPNEIAAHFIWMHMAVVAIVAVTRGLFAAEAVKFRVKVVCTQHVQWQMQRLKK